MYKRSEYRAGDYSVIRVESGTGAFFDIIPRLGAMVYRIGLPDEILEFDSPEELKSNPWFRGRILFPFNDRIPEGRYAFGDREFQLPVNEPQDGSSIHGLVYNRPFSEKESFFSPEEGRLVYACSLEPGDFPSYPFAVELEVRYTLKNEVFSTEYSFCNKGESPLPVALGWHPYFTLGGSADQWSLQCGGGRYVAVDDTLNPTGEIPAVTGTDFDFTEPAALGSRELDLALTAGSDGRTILAKGPVELCLTFDPLLFPYVQLFIPPDRKSIAIEPITAATNAFNLEGLGLIVLEPGRKRTGALSISLQKVHEVI